MPNNNLKMDLPRCSWVNLQNPLYVKYHDCEWGKPVHDDHRLFEMLLLESFQAGLSWETVLNKRSAFKQAFAEFDVDRVAKSRDHPASFKDSRGGWECPDLYGYPTRMGYFFKLSVALDARGDGSRNRSNQLTAVR